MGAAAGTWLWPGALWWHDQLAVVDTIAVQGSTRLDALEVAEATGVTRGTALQRSELAAIETRLEAHPWIASARVQLWPTRRLIVRISECEPVLAWRRDGADGETLWVDATGRAFAPARPEESAAYPTVVGTFEVPDRRLAEAAAIMRKAAEIGIPGPPSLRFEQGSEVRGWVLTPAALELEALLGAEAERAGERLGRLAQLLADTKTRVREATRVDLRFSGRAFLRFAERDGDSGSSREKAS